MSKRNTEEEDAEDYGEKLDKIIGELGLERDSKGLMKEKGKTTPSTESETEKLDNIIEDLQLEPPIKVASDSDEEELMRTILEKVDSKGKEISKKAEEVREPEFIIDPIYSPVYLNYKAYKRMVGYAMRHANDNIDMKKWNEVYGILIGTVEENTLVVVRDAIPVCVGGKTGVELEPIHYVDLSQIDAAVYERAIENKKTDFIVGWWHTHPSFGFFFSEVDSYTHLGYQMPNPFAVGLVFDHCEVEPGKFLGVAGLRLTEPEVGLLSDYRIVDLHYDQEVEVIQKKVKNVVEKIHKNMSKILKEIKKIDNDLRKKRLAQLQRNYGLILVPKKDVKVVKDEEEAIEEEDKVYVWDPDFYKKTFRIPMFRHRIESKISKMEMELRELLDAFEEKKYAQKREKYKKDIQTSLLKPKQRFDKLIDDFSKSIEIIYPYYDYLDTEERKVIEYFEERTTTYSKILESLINRSEFNLEG